MPPPTTAVRQHLRHSSTETTLLIHISPSTTTHDNEALTLPAFHLLMLVFKALQHCHQLDKSEEPPADTPSNMTMLNTLLLTSLVPCWLCFSTRMTLTPKPSLNCQSHYAFTPPEKSQSQLDDSVTTVSTLIKSPQEY
jgi:hypothetical protein